MSVCCGLFMENIACNLLTSKEASLLGWLFEYSLLTSHHQKQMCFSVVSISQSSPAARCPPPPLSLFLSEFLIAIDCRLLCAHILHYAHVVHSICRNDSLFIKSLQMLDGVSLYAVKGISWRVTLCTEPLVKIKSFRFVHLNYMQKNDYK